MTTVSESTQPVPARLVYEIVANQWARQTRSFVHSLHLYQEVARRRAQRINRVERQAVASVHAVIVGTRAGTRARADEDAEATAADGPSIAVLTHRQIDVARLIASGLSNEEIAQRLVLTPGTVGNHVGHILRRLGARNRAQVAAWVTRVADH